MDIDGDSFTQWKWYSDEINDKEEKYGRTSSWAGVDEFYTYAKTNSGYGLVASVDENVYSGSVGDILQYGSESEWRHSAIITNIIKDEEGNVLDYLVNSNTTDRINYPASACGYSDLRLIHIIGWNSDSTTVSPEGTV